LCHGNDVCCVASERDEINEQDYVRSVGSQVSKGVGVNKRILMLVAVSAMVFSASLIGITKPAASAGPAAKAATNAGVYIVAPKWWGWCPNIRGIQNRPWAMAAWNISHGGSASDMGDDIIWIRVQTGQTNRVDVQVGCSSGIGSSGTVVYIRPSRNGQTFWISPGGASYGN
jgi:hypothetical protein